MGTLRQLKMKMKMDRDWHKTLVRGSRNEILIDLDGDKEADIGLLDVSGNGDVDTIAIDLTGDGEFNLYFSDTDENGIPDLVLMDEEGNGDIKILGIGQEVEDGMISAAAAISASIVTGEYVSSVLEKALDEMEDEIKLARKQLKKRN